MALICSILIPHFCENFNGVHRLAMADTWTGRQSSKTRSEAPASSACRQFRQGCRERSFLWESSVKKKPLLVSSLLALNCFDVGTASASMYFYDDFENQPVTTPGQKMQLPPIGSTYYYNPDTQVEAVNVVT